MENGRRCKYFGKQPDMSVTFGKHTKHERAERERERFCGALAKNNGAGSAAFD